MSAETTTEARMQQPYPVLKLCNAVQVVHTCTAVVAGDG